MLCGCATHQIIVIVLCRLITQAFGPIICEGGGGGGGGGYGCLVASLQEARTCHTQIVQPEAVGDQAKEEQHAGHKDYGPTQVFPATGTPCIAQQHQRWGWLLLLRRPVASIQIIVGRKGILVATHLELGQGLRTAQHTDAILLCLSPTGVAAAIAAAAVAALQCRGAGIVLVCFINGLYRYV